MSDWITFRLLSCRRARRLGAGCRRALGVKPLDRGGRTTPSSRNASWSHVQAAFGLPPERCGRGGPRVRDQIGTSSHLLETRVFAGATRASACFAGERLAPPLATHLSCRTSRFALLHPDIEMEILSVGALTNLTTGGRRRDPRRSTTAKPALNLHGIRGPEACSDGVSGPLRWD